MSRTDLTLTERDQLAKIAALGDREIDLSDIPEAPSENWKYALRHSVQVDRDVLKWFEKRAGQNIATEINRVLRRYIAENRSET